ncbi:unnamed protein product [Effrenium voratum]|nr:unnamed protein product [Effrenium voratum]
MGNECSVQKVLEDTPPAPRPYRPRPLCERRVRLHSRAFALQRSSQAERWQAKYHTVEELGTGATATVLQAKAEAEPKDRSVSLFRCQAMSCTNLALGCTVAHGRPVAVKQFRKPGTKSFQLELSALMRVGVHPNIVRLLESYSGAEDVLVLEFCDSCTLFELIVKRHTTRRQFGPLLTGRLVQQLLLALEHVALCGVVHQDVKPENLMLYDLSIEEERVHMKLGDFGWAVTDGDLALKAPEGAGSLWYAPPELNPPTDEAMCKPGAVVGKSDMWSAGVVIYMILVGQNPFHSAYKLKDEKKVAHAVITMAAKGSFDCSSPAWLALSKDAKDFLSQLLQPCPDFRLEPSAARRHVFVKRCSKVDTDLADFGDPIAWAQLSGFQQLAWLALARACAEPELHPDLVQLASRLAGLFSERDAFGASESYLFHIAEKLSMQPVAWLKDGAWREVCSLAFRYLDVDQDGLLSAQDLARHVEDAEALQVAGSWVISWGDTKGLSEADFQAALFCEVQPGLPSSPVAPAAVPAELK